MTRNEIKEKLTEIFCEIFDDENIVLSDETSTNDIAAWDSLGHITLISEIETVFSIKTSMDDIGDMTSVNGIIKVIEREQK